MSPISPILVFGAGCIGRGLLGELSAQEGRPVVFVEASRSLAAALRNAGEYTVRLVGLTECATRVRDFRVIAAEDTDALRQALEQCACAATAVGGRHLESVAGLIAPALKQRPAPLNILLCENRAQADRVLTRALVAAGAPAGRFAAVPCSVERIVRAVPDSLDLVGESGESAWIDRSKWIGNEQPPAGLDCCDDLEPYYARKLYAANAGHALLAYEGFLAGYQALPDTVQDPAIRSRLTEQLALSARVLVLEYGMDPNALAGHLHKLMKHRFASRSMADRVERVARQPLRKLGPNERLVGLLRKLERHGLPIRPVCRTIAAAMHYEHEDDEESQGLQAMVRTDGPAHVLSAVCRIKPAETGFRVCLDEWAAIRKSRGASSNASRRSQ